MLHWTRKLAGAAALLFVAGAMMLSGCGDLNRSPVGADSEASNQNLLESPSGYLVFSQRAAVRAAKKVKVDQKRGDLLIVFDPEGTETSPILIKHIKFDKNGLNKNARMSYQFKDYIGDNPGQFQVKQAMFSVKAGSIKTELVDPKSNLLEEGESVDIWMQVVSGTGLENIIVKFAPSGLRFDPAAKLELFLAGDFESLVEGKQTLVAYHIGSDGEITKVSMETEEDKVGLKLTVEVPGFSRYGFGE